MLVGKCLFPPHASSIALDIEMAFSFYITVASEKEGDLKLESVDTTTDDDLGTDVDKIVETNSELNSEQEQLNVDTASDKSDNCELEINTLPSSVNEKDNLTLRIQTQSMIPEKSERYFYPFKMLITRIILINLCHCTL